MDDPANFDEPEREMDLEVWVAEADMQPQANVAELDKVEVGDEIFPSVHYQIIVLFSIAPKLSAIGSIVYILPGMYPPYIA